MAQIGLNRSKGLKVFTRLFLMQYNLIYCFIQTLDYHYDFNCFTNHDLCITLDDRLVTDAFKKAS